MRKNYINIAILNIPGLIHPIDYKIKDLLFSIGIHVTYITLYHARDLGINTQTNHCNVQQVKQYKIDEL